MYEVFGSTIIAYGFNANEGDTKHVSDGCAIIWLYVGDMLIFGKNMDIVNDTKNFLSTLFEMKDMGEANVILVVKITRTKMA